MKQSYKKIFENNRAWVEARMQQDPHFFERMAYAQNPDYLYIGCSDSRVSAEEMMGLNPGEVFVHRNVANVVNAIDMNASSVIQYAVCELKVKHIIVCGHYHCGGIAAAMEQKDYGLLNPWLRNIRDVYRIHQEELDAIEDPATRFDRLVELNVQEQVINVIKMTSVQQRYAEEGLPVVHGWIFDVRTGLLKDLEIDFEAILGDIMQIYNLTDKELHFASRRRGNPLK